MYARVTRVLPRDFASGRNPCGRNYRFSTYSLISILIFSYYSLISSCVVHHLLIMSLPSTWKLRARSIQPKFPEISVQHSMDRFGPTGKVSKKRVHLLRWTTFPGRTGWNFGWKDRALRFIAHACNERFKMAASKENTRGREGRFLNTEREDITYILETRKRKQAKGENMITNL